jgi:hypothetical protein
VDKRGTGQRREEGKVKEDELAVGNSSAFLNAVFGKYE